MTNFSLRNMLTLRNNRNSAAVSRETAENTRNNQSGNTLNPEMAEVYITQVSKELEGMVTKKIFGALSKLEELLLNKQVRTGSRTVVVTSRNSNSENREPTEDRSPNCFYPKVEFFVRPASSSADSSREEIANMVTEVKKRFPTALLGLLRENKKRRAPKSATNSQREHPYDNWSRPEFVGPWTIGDGQ